MTKEELQELYKSKIIPESREPYHFQNDLDSEPKVKANNPICGDKYELHFEDSNGKFDNVHFHGIGCAISMASTSFLIREIEGLNMEEAKKLIEDFLIALKGEENIELKSEGLKILSELRNFGGRMDCVKLSWEGMKEYFD